MWLIVRGAELLTVFSSPVLHLSQMNFQNSTVGSIDFSPHACCKEITLILNESDLHSAMTHQFERFWSVYYTDRAASLKKVTLSLRPAWSDETNGPVLDGINRFLAFFRDRASASGTTKPLAVYIDAETETANSSRKILLDTPYLVLNTKSPSQHKAAARPAILAGLTY